MRKASVFAAGAVLLLLLLTLALPWLVSVESLKPRVVAALEEKTGRRIGLSKLSLLLFPGIGVKATGLLVSGDARRPEEPFLAVPEAEIRMAILPLLSGRTEFTKFVLRRPEIRFRLYADGTHSAADLLERLAGERKPAASPAGEKGKETAVAVREVRVDQATVVLVSEEAGGKDSRWEISPITVRVSGIGDGQSDFEIASRVEGRVRGEVSFAGRLARALEAGEDRASVLRGEGKLFGQKVSVKGKIFASREPVGVDLEISFPGIGIGEVPEIFRDPPASLAKARLTGVVPMTARVTGSLDSPGFEARADLTRAGGTIPGDPEFGKRAGMPCTVVVNGRYAAGRLVLSGAEVRMPPLSVSANAVVHPASGAREWAASAVVSPLDGIGQFRGAEALSKWSPEGRLTASVKGSRKGAEAAETYEGRLDLDGAGFRVPGRTVDFRSIAGKITFSPRSVTIARLDGLLNGKRFSLAGETSLGPAPVAQGDLRLTYLDVDALFPPGEEVQGKEEKGAPQERTSKEEAPARKLSAQLRVAIDAGKARGMEFSDLRGLVRYEQGNVVLDSMKARMYGGNVAISGTVGLASSAPDFRLKVAAEELGAEQLLSRRTSLSDFLSGSMSLSADLGGGARDFADFSRTASGSGSIKITGGKIKGLDLLGTAIGLADLSSIVPGAGALSGEKAVKETTFSDLSASFLVEEGKIRTDSLRIVSEGLRLAGAAAVGFDRSLDFRGSIRLSKEMAKRFRGKAGKFLVGPEGEMEIPLFLKGSLTSPRASLDTAALAKGAGERLLRDLIKKIPRETPPPGGDNAAPAKKTEKKEPFREVEDILRKVLPRK